MKFLASGKVKDIYTVDEKTLLFRFSDRVSAYDVKFNESIPQKGRVLCSFAKYWFEKIPAESHFIEKTSETEITVKKMEMIPMECVVRGYFYGSLAARWKGGQIKMPEGMDTRMAARLPSPMFDPSTKSEHDMPVDREAAVKSGLVTEQEFDALSAESIRIYSMMAGIVDAAGFILADLKLEFGRLDGRIVLGDSIGPDECRIWPKDDYTVGRLQESYDKQILRDWLSAHGHQARFERERSAGQDPTPPPIPPEVAKKMTERYVASYERITGQSP